MDRKLEAKFEIGDEIAIISSGKIGTIKSIISYLGDGNNIYLVDVDGVDKTCVESNLRISRKKYTALSVDIKEVGINFMIEDKFREIIETLNLKEAHDDKGQLVNACKLQYYLTVNDETDDEITNIGNSVLKNELYHGLFNGETDPITNSYIFSEILHEVGMDVLNVVLKLEDSSFYVANLVLIGDDYYYFDLTLEKEIYKDNGSDPNNFVLCCGGLGSENYQQFFKPLCLLNFKDRLAPNSLPKNISMRDLDIDLVNKLLKMELR
jgi:hypothetical protein